MLHNLGKALDSHILRAGFPQAAAGLHKSRIAGTPPFLAMLRLPKVIYTYIFRMFLYVF